MIHISLKTFSRIVLAMGGLLAIVVLLWTIFGRSFIETNLILPEENFRGIDQFVKGSENTTSVIIVHGIGHHCLGYADNLITNLFEGLTRGKRKTESIKKSYQRYVENISDEVTYVSPLRDGSCEIIHDVDYEIGSKQLLNLDEDLESMVISQDELCESINGNSSGSDVEVSCHKLYVNRKHAESEGEIPEYVTGFIRRFSTDLTRSRRIRIYEVTWSPATRWIKQSLMDIERFNDLESKYPLNRRVKSDIINAGIADAVVYLSDSGILVNFDILQAFCLTLANTNSLHEEYPFACDKKHLAEAMEGFSKKNNIYLITHSLGTRVLFDSLGMLALGTVSPSKEGESEQTLVSSIATKFERIGALVPEEYTETSGSELTFTSALNQAIPEFARAVRSIYVFTNQVPLLAANLTSPFKRYDAVGKGFRRFLELQNPNNSLDARLQLVSFHDPDDVLSYNLGCWYYQTVLKQLDETKDMIDREAEDLANENGTKVGDERRKLRDTLFANNCSDGKFDDIGHRTLFRQIWAAGENRIELVNAPVRLKGLRFAWLAADPMGVHSNYFIDETVHEWLAKGN